MRLIVRRVRPTPSSQLALFASYSYHGLITDRDGETLELEADHRRDGETLELEADHRRHAETLNAIRDLKYGVGLNHMPSGRFAANGAWLAVQVMAHNLARWTGPHRLGRADRDHQDLRRRFFALAGRITRSARRLTLHLFQALALGNPVQPRPGPAASHSAPRLTVGLQPAHPADNRRSQQTRASPVRGEPLLRILSPSRASQPPQTAIGTLCGDCRPSADLQSTPRSPGHLPCSSLTPPPLSSRRPAVSFGGFGVKEHGGTNDQI